MKLNDLIRERNDEVVEDVLFEESELNEVYKGKRYFSADFQKDVEKFTKKAGKEGNPFRALLKDNKVSTVERDLGSEVSGLPNAKDIMSLAGEYREQKKTIESLANEFDKWKKESGTKISRIADDDADAHKSMPKTVKERLNKFYNQYKHYAKLLPKAAEKAKKIEPEIAAAKRKAEVSGNVQKGKEARSEKRKEAVSDFKKNVKQKAQGVSDSVESAANKFKKNVKKKVKSMRAKKA